MNIDMLRMTIGDETIAKEIRGMVPLILSRLVEALGAEAGVAKGTPFSAALFTAANATGTPTTMARVHAINAMMEPGEEVACFDVVEAFSRIPDATIIGWLPS